MDEDEFVETSDPEELELCFAALKRFHSPDDCASPPKRTKLYHAPISASEPSSQNSFAFNTWSEAQLVVADSQENALPDPQQREEILPDVNSASPESPATDSSSFQPAKVEGLPQHISPTRLDRNNHTGLSLSDVPTSLVLTPCSGTSPGSSGSHVPDYAPEQQEPEQMEACIARSLASSQSPQLAYSSLPLWCYIPNLWIQTYKMYL
ncbi:hypothetical protein PTI98_007465 [Pleurotus ostreatus]|nr:hypothetical protein PTI98_007465 [Pleurotus ostreatus]